MFGGSAVGFYLLYVVASSDFWIFVVLGLGCRLRSLYASEAHRPPCVGLLDYMGVVGAVVWISSTLLRGVQIVFRLP
jgi:hypothetical protein